MAMQLSPLGRRHSPSTIFWGWRMIALVLCLHVGPCGGFSAPLSFIGSPSLRTLSSSHAEGFGRTVFCSQLSFRVLEQARSSERGPSRVEGTWLRMVAPGSKEGQSKHQAAQVTIRPAVSQDIQRILEVSMGAFYGEENLNILDLAQLFRLRQTPNGKSYFGVEYHWTRNTVEKRIKEGIVLAAKPASEIKPSQRCAVFVAEVKEDSVSKVVGTVEVILLPCPAVPAPLRPYLFNLCVDPSYRSQGIGRKLVEACESLSVEWGFPNLFLHVEDRKILEIYSKMGYLAQWQQPSFLELNLMNKLVVDYQPEGLKDGAWVIMNKNLTASE